MLTHPPYLVNPTLQARGVSSRVFGIVERLASKGHGKVSETFGNAALKWCRHSYQIA